MDAPLYNRIKELTGSQTYPLHMPGHKRNLNFIEDTLLNLDVTEIDGTDNMHHPREVILQAEEKLAELNSCDKALFLVNGGSSGILTAILGTVGEGDKIIVGRNAHKSVHNGLVLSGATPVYVYPEVLSSAILGGITPDNLNQAFKAYPDTKAVIVTSPTYEGFICDIKALAEIAHKNNAILIVDETHGAHFPFSKSFPQSAMEAGADISINSWHKTLPCPNQSAVINLKLKRLDLSRLTEAYSMVQTTSPSYIMMSIMDKVRGVLTENRQIFDEYIDSLRKARDMLKNLKGLRLIDNSTFSSESTVDYDISKLVILTGKNFSGKALAQILLKEYNIQIELAAPDYIIAMTSVADTALGLFGFAKAICEIDKGLPYFEPSVTVKCNADINCPVSSPRKAFYAKTKYTSLESSVGFVAGECITPFPPDIPLILTGEKITKEHLEQIKIYRKLGITLLGGQNGKIKIIEEN